MEVSFGNNKLDKNIAIFNMNSATDCPSEKLGLCDVCDICYAKKAEKQYKAVLPYRRRQEEYWDSVTAQKFVDDLMEKSTYKAGAKKGQLKIKFLRLSEAGDFKTQLDLDKADTIAGLLRKRGVMMYCYSARSDLDISGVKYLTINGSGWMAHNNFKIGKNLTEDDGILCRGDCGPCTLCVHKRGITINVESH